jgi:hypothetical protein
VGTAAVVVAAAVVAAVEASLKRKQKPAMQRAL